MRKNQGRFAGCTWLLAAAVPLFSNETFKNTAGQCYSRSIAAVGGAVTAVDDGTGCPD